ncbi:hypothetical protein V6R21_12250 [Limibacter armeniacum]|uniref:hypothetical protein n=1 Tax=Limibacter armeniacum TaxID=466084 RepID=UPI002FE625A1
MNFLEVEVKTAMIFHGFDGNNKEIIEEVVEENFMKKLVAVGRIQSISEQYLLVTSSHGRVMYWEYKGTMEDLKQRLALKGVNII